MPFRYQIIPKLLCELITPDIVKYEILPYLQPNPITCNKNYAECVKTLKLLLHYNHIYNATRRHQMDKIQSILSILKVYKIKQNYKQKQIIFITKNSDLRSYIFQYT